MWLTDFYQNKLDPARTKRFNILHKSGHSGVGVPACVRACVRVVVVGVHLHSLLGAFRHNEASS
jgi:hypothetical protein